MISSGPAVSLILKAAIAALPLLTFCSLQSLPTKAQVIFDGSLSDAVAPGDVPSSAGMFTYEVLPDQGLSTSSTLFHSFSQFNLRLGESIRFSSGDIASDIITRVTGGDISSIAGLISSDASFYLINPNGVIFREGAELDVNGSFFASTADGIFFDGETIFFNARDPGATDLTLLEIAQDPGNFSEILNNSGDILVDRASLDSPNGLIRFDANNITIANNAELNTDITFDGAVGGIALFANNQVVVDSSVLSTNAVSQTGDAGLLLINADSIHIDNGTQLRAGTFGTGRAGVIQLVTPDSGSVIFDNSSVAFSTVEEGGDSQNSGLDNVSGTPFHILIQTGQLILDNDSELQTLVDSDAAGSAGWIGIIANDVELSNLSAIFSDVRENAAPGSGAGAVGLFVDDLALDSALITTSVLSDGEAGFILVDATGDIFLENGSSILSAVDEGVTATANPDAAGAIAITTSRLGLGNGSFISATNFGTGAGGNIDIVATVVSLDNLSVIASETRNGTAGDIQIDSDSLVLTGTSNISTFAAAGGNGGNIELNILEAIFASPAPDNNIVASAPEGVGGQINFGPELFLSNIAPRDVDALGSNDITASGGVEAGEVGFRSGTQDVNPVQEQVTLPTELIDPSRLIAQGCAAGNLTAAQEIGELVVTGRGGLPPSPREQLADAGTVSNLVSTPSPSAEVSLTDGVAAMDETGELEVQPTADETTAYIEAQAWTYGPDGEVVLMASTRAAMPRLTGWTVPVCGDVSQ